MQTLSNKSRWGISSAAILVAIGVSQTAMAQDSSPNELIVTGTRTTGLKAVDSPAPIQVVDSTTLKQVGQTELAQALTQNVPSFTAQAFGGDQANNTLSARLRGISPNHALVLVNGKRRHGTSSFAVLSGAYQGSAAADLNFLPVGSIDRIEVLTDGAAAQYGSDAIAGVINIILKKNKSGGSIALSGGEYFDGGGKTGDITANLGTAPTENSYLNLTFQSKSHGYSDRGNIDPRIAVASNFVGGVIDKALPGYPHVNKIFGDGAYRLNVLAVNAGVDLSDSWNLYSFGTYGVKDSSSYENWRTPVRIPALYPKGFSPREQNVNTDTALTFGINGELGGWALDLSSTYARNESQLYNNESANLSLYADRGYTPTSFYNGAFVTTQRNTSLGFNRDFEVGLTKPLNLAFGVEHRTDTYQIKAGDEASRYKAGSQAFPGFALTDAGRHSRDNTSAYVDVAFNPLEAWSVDAAARFEDYSDFGNTSVGKLTSRYDFNPAFAIRGTVSTGFRAPTLAESYYSATNVSPTAAFVQLPPNSAAAKLLGIQNLKPEKSKNYSFGVVARPVSNLTLTIDAYQIDITDRILGTGSVYGIFNGVSVNTNVTNAILANGNILDPTVTNTGVNLFVNGADTKTKGIDVVATYPVNYGALGKVSWSVSATFNETEIEKLAATPAALQPVAPNAPITLFSREAQSYIETASPKYRIIGAANWTVGNWGVVLRETFYGKASGQLIGNNGIWYTNTIDAKAITDLDISYKISKGLKLSLGANNLFNVYPNEFNKDLLTSYGVSNQVVAKYPTFSPFGINGGYYYSKLTVSF